jgi:hypothetical protein
MTEKPWDTYPDDYDILWIAADEADKVAVFLSAGRGPIPRTLLEDYDLLEIDNGFMDLPSVSRGISTSATEFSDHFQTLSSKGAYFYDWSDVHRTTGFLRAYERLATPPNPIVIDKLPDLLKKAASVVRFKDVYFQTSLTLRPQDIFECPRPTRS